MDSILKKGVLLVSLTGIMTAFPMAVHAADIDDTQNIPAAGNTQILEDCYTSDKTIPVNDHLVPEQKGEYSDMAFANVQSFLYIRSEPTTDSEWVGKLILGQVNSSLGTQLANEAKSANLGGGAEAESFSKTLTELHMDIQPSQLLVIVLVGGLLLILVSILSSQWLLHKKPKELLVDVE